MHHSEQGGVLLRIRPTYGKSPGHFWGAFVGNRDLIRLCLQLVLNHSHYNTIDYFGDD